MKKTASPMLAAGIAASGATAAYAGTQYPVEGGVWDYGYNAVTWTMYSNYDYPTRCHGTTVIHGTGSSARKNRSADTAPGKRAEIALGWVGPGDVKNYYYRVC